MNTRWISRAAGVAILFAGLAAAGGAAKAPSAAPAPPGPQEEGNVTFFRTGPGPIGAGDEMDFVGFEAGPGGKTVTGAPFTATISVKRTQVLADGNRIDRTTTGSIARDSQGRVRRDMTLPAIGAFAAASQDAPHVIFINDVVSGTQYILEPDRKIAHDVRLIRRGGRIRVQPNAGGPDLKALGMPPDEAVGNVTTTSLGTQTINGVLAQGTRYTRTIPAGQIGNEKAILITTDRWYSPDLQMYVLTKTSDPMRGDSVRQLTDIQMGEPDPSLFQVPPGYAVQKGGVVTIHQSGGMVTIRRRMRRGAMPAPPPPPDDAPDLAPPPQN
jgi:hypothetical protein